MEEALLPEECKFTFTSNNPNIQSLAIDWKEEMLIIPKFQRGFVWNIKQASKFIESLLLELPIPNLFFYKDDTEKQYIIDGQQRLKTIFYFMGAISKEDVSEKERKFVKFKLQNLSPKSKWNNVSFDDLTETDRRRFLHRTLNITLINLNENQSLKGIYHVFERLNTGGTPLSEQEIRNCVYGGIFNEFLLKLNENKYWRHFITVDTETSHQKDVELILRFFALYDNWLHYKKPMKTFLSDYMRNIKISGITDDELNKKQRLFEDVVKAIYDNLGCNPFHILRSINSAVCDSVMVGFAHNLDNIPSDIRERYDKLTHHNSEYYAYVSKTSNDSKSVYKRIKMVEQHLFPPKQIHSINTENKNKIRLYSSLDDVKNALYEDKNFKYIDFYTSNSKAEYAVKITGDNMSPSINDGDILLVKKTNKPKNGDIVIVTCNNIITCRKIVLAEKSICLKSVNGKYKQIRITQESTHKFYCIGVVVETINGNTLDMAIP